MSCFIVVVLERVCNNFTTLEGPDTAELLMELDAF